MESAHSTESSRKLSSTRQSHVCWTDGEVKILIAIYSRVPQTRQAMKDRIAAALVAESKQIKVQQRGRYVELSSYSHTKSKFLFGWPKCN